MTVQFQLSLGDIGGILAGFCGFLGVVAAVTLFAIRMIVRAEIASLVEKLEGKYQTKAACEAIRTECEKRRRLETCHWHRPPATHSESAGD